MNPGAAIEDAPTTPDEQAADWCMRLAEDTLDAVERRAFDAWLTDPAHRAAFEQAVIVWQGVETAADQPEFIRLRSRALEHFRRANSRRWAERAVHRLRRPVVAAAAGALALLAIAIVLVLAAPQVYETGIGERRVITLEDGSRISLDAATRVKVRLRADRRELRLVAGRAMFDVAREPLRPFSVALANKVVVATGTAFSVELLRRQMHVVLYEGRVAVLHTPPGAGHPHPLSDTELMPGHELIASLDDARGSIVPADLLRARAWEGGQLDFSEEPLASAIERMNRYSRVKLAIGDAAAATFNINGVFTAGDTNAFVEGVTALLPVEATRGREIIVLGTTVAGRKSADGAVPPSD